MRDLWCKEDMDGLSTNNAPHAFVKYEIAETLDRTYPCINITDGAALFWPAFIWVPARGEQSLTASLAFPVLSESSGRVLLACKDAYLRLLDWSGTSSLHSFTSSRVRSLGRARGRPVLYTLRGRCDMSKRSSMFDRKGREPRLI